MQTRCQAVAILLPVICGLGACSHNIETVIDPETGKVAAVIQRGSLFEDSDEEVYMRDVEFHSPDLVSSGAPSFLAYVKRAGVVDYKSGKNQTKALREFLIGLVGLRAIGAQEATDLGAQSVEKARIGAAERVQTESINTFQTFDPLFETGQAVVPAVPLP